MEYHAVEINAYAEDVAKIYRKFAQCVDTELSQGWSLHKQQTGSGHVRNVTFTNKMCCSVMGNLEAFFELFLSTILIVPKQKVAGKQCSGSIGS